MSYTLGHCIIFISGAGGVVAAAAAQTRIVLCIVCLTNVVRMCYYN